MPRSLHPRRAAALLLEPGVVDREHPAGVTEPLGELGPQRVTHRIDVPFRVPSKERCHQREQLTERARPRGRIDRFRSGRHEFQTRRG